MRRWILVFQNYSKLHIIALKNHSPEMSLPLQVWPSPENPGKQLHVKDPKLFVHDAFKLHRWMLAVHSSISWIREKEKQMRKVFTGADLGGGCRGCAFPPPLPWDDLRFSNTTGILQKKKMWCIGVEVEQETSAPPPKKYSGSAHDLN